MVTKLNMIVFPEGDTQELGHGLHINDMVDVNGYPLALPLPTNKIIAFRVIKISTRTTRNEEIRLHHLELIRADELTEFVR